MSKTLFTLLLISGLVSVSGPALGQGSGHRLFAVADRFFLEERATGVVRPFEMWNTRIANALMDRVTTDRVVAALDDYARYGVNTVCVSIQGAELGPNKNQYYPRAFLSDGTRDPASPVWSNLARLLDETDRRGIAVCVMIWYHRRNAEVPVDADVVRATRDVTAWLLQSGHRHYFFDVVNEFDHYAYRLPGSTTRRPVFTTLEGALALVDAVKSEDPAVLVGVSPLSALQYPVGVLPHPKPRSVEADMIIGHGAVIDPLNRAAYRFGVSPTNPRQTPYVNNEFFQQLRYELYVKRDPRTGALTYGHWDQTTMNGYLADVVKLRGFGGSPNVFSHFQQYIPPQGRWPVFEVGPAGTQPEAVSAPGEGSMHWLFKSIAGYRRFGATPLRLDFDEAHGGGLDEGIAGTWAYANGRLEQRDATAAPAWARIAADDGDVEIAFDAAFLASSGGGWLGAQVGGPTPADPAVRLEIDRTRVRMVEVGSARAPVQVAVAKGGSDRYVLRLRRGRARVSVNGVHVIDTIVPGTGADQNLLLLADRATAAFDNVRMTPLRSTDFEDGTAGAWRSERPPAGWSVVNASPTNRVWEAVVGASATGLASLDRSFGDAAFGVTIDFGSAATVAVRARAASATDTSGDGYTVTLTRGGSATLTRDVAGSPARSLGRAQVSITPSAVRLVTSTEGRRIVVAVDGRRVLDVVDSADGPRRGRYQLVAFPGTTRFDDLDVQAGADRYPDVGLIEGPGPRIGAGTVFVFHDDDGVNDLATLGLEVSIGGGAFRDVTMLLHPIFNLFALDVSSRAFRFTLRQSIPIGPTSWQLRLTATDRSGHRVVRTVRLLAS